MKYVYFFGDGKADGKAEMKNELGGKGANLAEMTNLGIPVPPGFTLTTETNAAYFEAGGKLPQEAMDQTREAIARVEAIMGRKFGDPENPLLISVRSGARKSMPGMMETVLNVGLCSATIPGMIKQSGNERFVYDAYRRLITMYSDVVMEKAAGVEYEDEEMAIRPQLERVMTKIKRDKGYKLDTELTTDDLKKLCEAFKAKVEEVLGKKFPDDPLEQLWGGIGAVFQSWRGKRAVSYRRIENIPEDWGTAVNVQTMVFGNMGEDSATGVAFTRDPATGDSNFFGEWLVNAQGEDVVAGIRTPNAINIYCKQPGKNDQLPSLEEAMPELYKELVEYRNRLERHYTDMQDLEFTIEHGRLWMLQTRTGKRNGLAAIRMAVDMMEEGLINDKEALRRVRPDQLDELLHPMLDPREEKRATVLAKGLAAGPGGAIGKIVLHSERAWEMAKKGERVILVRLETSPEDVDGMRAAEGILTAHGGMTSHAALVARGWGKCCVVGCSDLDVNYQKRTVSVKDKTLKEGDWITLNGTKGIVYEGQIPVVNADPDSNQWYKKLMTVAEKTSKLEVRTNADTPEDAAIARKFGARGIGLTRTEHMFFGEDRIRNMRAMILSDTAEEREEALKRLLPYQRNDFYGILKAMSPFSVTIRLLDPPLHEFLPQQDDNKKIDEIASDLSVSASVIRSRIEQLHEFNPMLGHRGCRLGVTMPEVTRMQVRAILEAAASLKKEGVEVHPEIMVPLVGNSKELENQRKNIVEVADKVKEELGVKDLEYKIGTMIEVPRAAVTADEIAKHAEFFSFGTNDLTQMGCGFSRDDSGSFLPYYVESGIYEDDPFTSIDQKGIGELVRIAIEKGRATRKNIHLGVCGEHGGDPKSVVFFHKVGLDYVSCSPFRVPIARFAAALAALED
ncbi:Pyruvate, phosphate dikinase [uncultured Desulfobacterium sp.]|uniref:Pyruvate, phosphate dikinase n=1 Tax=uncultured Desulfobacterium sp. TaxID=201089 RepID=A0A445N1N8_9BACT|nr:Pyruvate, phosphate dikinase [uncultured Desulfobacterium sp.]